VLHGKHRISKASNARRVVRGGSWAYFARYCRSAIRHVDSPDSRDYARGFRLAAGLELKEVGEAELAGERMKGADAP